MASLQLYLIFLTITNSIIYLTAQYEGFPPWTGQRFHSALGHTFEFKCRYIGTEGTGEFLGWFKQNSTHDVSVNTDKPGHYIVRNNEKESSLLIKIFVNADADVTKWYVKTNKHGSETPRECQFSQIELIPSPQGMISNLNETLNTPHASIRRTEDQPLNLQCVIKPAVSNQNNHIQWEFSEDEKTFTELPADVTVTKQTDRIQFDSVRKAHRGYYRCKLNDISFTVLLRVKDRLAALWPFIGIISVVLTLVIVILIYEKRQKSNKRTVSNDDDEQDRASDPLVRTAIKTPDNDKKNRAVKA